MPKRSLFAVFLAYILLYSNIVHIYDNNTCFLDVQIETIKIHQIHAQLAHIGFPIIIDGKYCKNEFNMLFHQKSN